MSKNGSVILFVHLVYCRVSFNSDVTRHRARNLRIFSNLSQVTEGIFECAKKVTKSREMPKKIQISRALRVLLVEGGMRTFLAHVGP
jgi:hypothetical protein